jgi:hypothetical protein
MKEYNGCGWQFIAFWASALDMSKWLEVPTALSGGNVPRILDWLGPRRGLVAERRTFTPSRNQTPAVRLVCGPWITKLSQVITCALWYDNYRDVTESGKCRGVRYWGVKMTSANNVGWTMINGFKSPLDYGRWFTAVNAKKKSRVKRKNRDTSYPSDASN